MSFRIDRTRRAVSAHQTGAGADRKDAQGVQSSLLPVPVGPVTSPPRPDRRNPESAFNAHVLGQDGQKRGLRGGTPVLEAARKTYTTVEWSGANDRRGRKGRIARAVA
jgi:hypothetical protein